MYSKIVVSTLQGPVQILHSILLHWYFGGFQSSSQLLERWAKTSTSANYTIYVVKAGRSAIIK